MRLSFVISEIFSGMRRNLLMIVSVVLVTFVSLAFVGSALLLQSQVGKMKGYWYDRVHVAVFMCNTSSQSPNCTIGKDGLAEVASDEQRKSVEDTLNSPAMKPYVASFDFESQEQALAQFKKDYSSNDMSESVTAEQLPASFRIKLVDPEQYKVIQEQFSAMPGVEAVTDRRQVLQGVFSLMNTATVVAASIAGIMAVCAVLLISTTIRLSAHSRRKEIEIMRLVGASKRFIQIPFTFEGVMAALIGGVLAVGTLWAVVQFVVQDRLAKEYPTIAFIDGATMWWLAPVLLVAGALVAGVTSLLTLKRHLKV